MWQGALAVGGGGGGSDYVLFQDINANVDYILAECDSVNNTFTVQSIKYTSPSGTSLETNLLTISGTGTAHSFTVTYKKNCTCNGVAKTAGTSETLANALSITPLLFIG